MSYVYAKAATLADQPVMGDQQCVWLVRHFTKAPHTSLWRPGIAVRGAVTLPVGTAIATFVDGRYPSKPHGNHAAIYLGQDACGIWVVDQWKRTGKTKITRRRLAFGALVLQAPQTPQVDVDDGNAYSVVE